MQTGTKFQPLQASKDSPIILDAVKRHWMTCIPKITGTSYHKLKPNKKPWRWSIILSCFPSVWRIGFHCIYIKLQVEVSGSQRESPNLDITHHSAIWTWNRRAHCFRQKRGKYFFPFVFTREELGSLQDYVTAWHELWQLCGMALWGHVAACRQLLNCSWFLWGHLMSQSTQSQQSANMFGIVFLGDKEVFELTRINACLSYESALGEQNGWNTGEMFLFPAGSRSWSRIIPSGELLVPMLKAGVLEEEEKRIKQTNCWNERKLLGLTEKSDHKSCGMWGAGSRMPWWFRRWTWTTGVETQNRS